MVEMAFVGAVRIFKYRYDISNTVLGIPGQIPVYKYRLLLTAKDILSVCFQFNWHLFTSFTLDIRGSHCSAEGLSVLGYDTVGIGLVADLPFNPAATFRM